MNAECRVSKECRHAHERYTSTFIIPCSIFDIHEGKVGAARPAGCYPNAPIFEPGQNHATNRPREAEIGLSGEAMGIFQHSGANALGSV